MTVVRPSWLSLSDDYEKVKDSWTKCDECPERKDCWEHAKGAYCLFDRRNWMNRDLRLKMEENARLRKSGKNQK